MKYPTIPRAALVCARWRPVRIIRLCRGPHQERPVSPECIPGWHPHLLGDASALQGRGHLCPGGGTERTVITDDVLTAPCHQGNGFAARDQV